MIPKICLEIVYAARVLASLEDHFRVHEFWSTIFDLHLLFGLLSDLRRTVSIRRLKRKFSIIFRGRHNDSGKIIPKKRDIHKIQSIAFGFSHYQRNQKEVQSQRMEPASLINFRIFLKWNLGSVNPRIAITRNKPKQRQLQDDRDERLNSPQEIWKPAPQALKDKCLEIQLDFKINNIKIKQPSFPLRLNQIPSSEQPNQEALANLLQPLILPERDYGASKQKKMRFIWLSLLLSYFLYLTITIG